MSEKNVDQEKPVCFVLMPIADVPGYESGHFARVYEHLLKPAILNAGYVPLRADDTVKTDYIVVGIIQKIVECAMVICDFSSRNPNVMYELGIRHAFNKPVVLIKDKKTEKIFDIQGLRYVEYDESLRIDAVTKDVARIASSIKETSAVKPGELNSIVQLANIKAAEVPAGQIISGDTQLILSAIGSLEKRVQRVEEEVDSDGRASGAVDFLVESDSVTFSQGGTVKIGERVYQDGKEVGVLSATSPSRRSFLITKKRSGGELQFEFGPGISHPTRFSAFPF